MKKETSKRLTREQLAELKSLGTLSDSAIDTSDAPELLDWSGAKRGLFYRPVKQQLTLRLDADVVGWFKSHTTSNEGYQPPLARAATDPSSPPKGMGGTRVPLAGVKQTAPSGSGPSRAILRQGGQRR